MSVLGPLDRERKGQSSTSIAAPLPTASEIVQQSLRQDDFKHYCPCWDSLGIVKGAGGNMVGSGIASASRKPAGSRGSWLKRGRAGYLSPRHLCTNDIQYSVPSFSGPK